MPREKTFSTIEENDIHHNHSKSPLTVADVAVWKKDTKGRLRSGSVSEQAMFASRSPSPSFEWARMSPSILDSEKHFPALK